jgi:hypothetical protein
VDAQHQDAIVFLSRLDNGLYEGLICDELGPVKFLVSVHPCYNLLDNTKTEEPPRVYESITIPEASIERRRRLEERIQERLEDRLRTAKLIQS